MTSAYDTEFFAYVADESLRSARLIVPMILEMFAPRSVVDFGCGPGSWLRAFMENGVGEVKGIDGDYLDPSQLVIDEKFVSVADLTEPFRSDRQYDLALCIEVAEHLPESSSSALIDILVTAAPTILFSAAIPGQGGTNHVNEQWLDYWEGKFAERGYSLVDAVRNRIRDESRIASYIRQNLVLFVNDGTPISHFDNSARSVDSEWVHIDLYKKWFARGSAELGVKELLSRLPRALLRSAKRRLSERRLEAKACLTKASGKAVSSIDSACR